MGACITLGEQLLFQIEGVFSNTWQFDLEMTPMTFVHEPRSCNATWQGSISRSTFPENITRLVCKLSEKMNSIVCFTAFTEIHHIYIRGGSKPRVT